MSVVTGKRNIGKQKLYALTQAERLCAHTFRLTKNKNVFPPEYEDLIKQTNAAAFAVYHYGRAANDTPVEDKASWNRRKNLAKESLRSCGRLMDLIDICHRTFHLRRQKFEYWSRLAYSVRELLAKWHESDLKRYRNLGK